MCNKYNTPELDHDHELQLEKDYTSGSLVNQDFYTSLSFGTTVRDWKIDNEAELNIIQLWKPGVKMTLDSVSQPWPVHEFSGSDS